MCPALSLPFHSLYPETACPPVQYLEHVLEFLVSYYRHGGGRLLRCLRFVHFSSNASLRIENFVPIKTLQFVTCVSLESERRCFQKCPSPFLVQQ